MARLSASPRRILQPHLIRKAKKSQLEKGKSRVIDNYTDGMINIEFRSEGAAIEGTTRTNLSSDTRVTAQHCWTAQI